MSGETPLACAQAQKQGQSGPFCQCWAMPWDPPGRGRLGRKEARPRKGTDREAPGCGVEASVAGRLSPTPGSLRCQRRGPGQPSAHRLPGQAPGASSQKATGRMGPQQQQQQEPGQALPFRSPFLSVFMSNE